MSCREVREILLLGSGLFSWEVHEIFCYLIKIQEVAMYVKVWDSGKVLVVMLDGILSQMGWGCRKFENIELGLKIDPDYPISQFLSGSKYNTCLISVLYDLNLAVKLNPDKILSRI